MTELNDEQLAAVQTESQHCLVLAGAGTGKTTTIVSRCIHLVNLGVNEREILMITFTRKAASEVRSRINSQMRRQVSIFAGTFHSFAARIMRNNPKLFDFDSPTLIDREDSSYAYKLFKRVNPTPPGINLRALEEAGSLAMNTRLSMEDCLKKMGMKTDYVEYFDKSLQYYRDFKRARNYVDYDDTLERLATALNNPKIASAIGKRFKHVLIDEMQDTNPLQWLIVDQLVKHCSIYCVGDDAQSIYGFRGADFESIHGFAQRVPNASILRLTENYRSTQHILDLSNWLLAQSPLQYGKTLTSSRGDGQFPTIVECENEYDQADFISQKILDSFGIEAKWSNNMVLIRGGNRGRYLETRFIEAEIPYILIGGVGLLGAKHVKDLLSIVRIVANRFDEVAWLRYLELWSGLGETKAWELFTKLCGEKGWLATDGESRSLAEILQTYIKEDKFGWVKPILSCLSCSASPAEIINTAISELQTQMQLNYKNDNWEARSKDFIFLRDLAQKHTSIGSFVEEYLINPVYEKDMRMQEDTDVVKLITIHSAKGLEAKRCFITDVQPGTFPSIRSKEVEEIEEERRVLYVGLTRAADELYICRSTRGWSGKRVELESYFFNKLPEVLFESNVQKVEDAANDDGEYEINF